MTYVVQESAIILKNTETRSAFIDFYIKELTGLSKGETPSAT